MYHFNSRIRFSEVDPDGYLRISSIINYFQDCSTFQSEDLNIGLSYLGKQNKGWLLNGWQLIIYRRACLGENIMIGTWPYDFKGIYGYRNFIMRDAKNDVIAVANSIWVFMDMETMHPVRIPGDHLGYELEPRYPMVYADRKVAVPAQLTAYPAFPVRKSNIDSYHHVNNGQYIRMAEEFLPENFKAVQMRVEYKCSAVLGDTMIPMVSMKDHICNVVLTDSEGKQYTIVEFTDKID